MVQKSVVHQLRLVVFTIIYRVFYIPGVFRISSIYSMNQQFQSIVVNQTKAIQAKDPVYLGIVDGLNSIDRVPAAPPNPLLRFLVYFSCKMGTDVVSGRR